MTDAKQASTPTDIATKSIALVERWLAESSGESKQEDPAAERLAELLRDPNGLEFAVGFVDGVARPQDVYVAAENLKRLAASVPRFLPWHLRTALEIGGSMAPAAPWVVVPIARRVLRRMVGHLIVDATPKALGTALSRLRSASDPNGHGARLNLNLLGEAVLGDREASRRLRGTERLLARDDVDYVSVKVSAVAAQLTMWAFDETVARVVDTLLPLYRIAANSPTPKFINLDMEEYKDLDLTIAVFTALLSRDEFHDLEAGIVLQAYLPDALGALQNLTEWATERRAGGGAAIKVRVVKGANLAMERVDAAIHDWPLATWESKQGTDGNYKRVLDWAFTPEHTHAVKIGVAGHNLFDLAFAWLLAEERGVEDRIDVEMLLGMATAQAEAVKRTVGGLLLYTPVVQPAEFDVAISYLIRRLEENASSENFMSAVFDIGTHRALFERERDRFLASVRDLENEEGPRGYAPLPRRRQNRATEWETGAAADFTRAPAPEPASTPGASAEEQQAGLTNLVLGLNRGSAGDGPLAATGAVTVDAAALLSPPPTSFHNAPDTDPSLDANRAWGRRIMARSTSSELGCDSIQNALVTEQSDLDALIAEAHAAGVQWGQRPASERAVFLDRAGLALSANRDRLLEVMAAETGKTIAEGDPEVSEAVDFAHYYAERARELDSVQGARFVPSALTVVAPPWNFPASIPAGGVLAALGAGSAVIIKPAPQARRTGAVMVEALWEAGVPREVLRLVDVDESDLGRSLISDARVDRVILTGSYDTAALFRSWRPDLPLVAETSGKNAIVITPSADYDLAVADLVASAFGHAGQKCSAASLAILVGSVGTSPRFLNQLVDAVTSVRVGYPSDPSTRMGPLIEPASGKLLAALTTLEPGEEWLVQPKRLDEEGRLWTPGVRTGVVAGSTAHLTEFFGPVLSIMRARDLAEAVELQNQVPYGLTAGLHSLDADEVDTWVDAVQAGNLYVNRTITGAIVRRQPFGGWKRSSVGTATKAGGPSYLMGLGGWEPDEGRPSSSLHLRGLEPAVTELIEAAQPSLPFDAFDTVRRSALSDEIAWATEFGEGRDVSGVGVERNILRYRPVPVHIRMAEGAAPEALLRVMAAGLLSRSTFSVSASVAFPSRVLAVLQAHGVSAVVQDDVSWLAALATDGSPAGRIRVVAADRAAAAATASAAAAALKGSPDVAIHANPVTPSGRVELLPFLHEQAVSVTAHRFGTPSSIADEIS